MIFTGLNAETPDRRRIGGTRGARAGRAGPVIRAAGGDAKRAAPGGNRPLHSGA